MAHRSVCRYLSSMGQQALHLHCNHSIRTTNNISNRSIELMFSWKYEEKGKDKSL